MIVFITEYYWLVIVAVLIVAGFLAWLDFKDTLVDGALNQEVDEHEDDYQDRSG